ncbi:TauD/TfdA family dioxygenase [Streptomyces sp. P1-3]|uniref:TauD/TfdA family dioxygenase n=1 Tax=Streptomyces sp. P1-3 TaxID=3421658 RepID=UPI003D364C57
MSGRKEDDVVRRAAVTGWSRHSFASPAVFRLPYVADHVVLARRTRKALLDGPGFAVVTGVPVTSMTIQDLQRFSESMLSHLGVPLTQGRGADMARAWLVRDEGVSAHTDDRRFHENAYTSKSRGYLHLHNDRAVRPFGHEPDYLALLTHRRARQGGDSLLADGWAVHQILCEEFPRELDVLHTPFPFDRRHVTPPGGSPVVWAPVFEERDGRVHVRCNVKRNETAAELTGAPLPSGKRAALDALKHVLDRPDLRVSILLEAGDCLITDDRRVLHGRTAYDDHATLRRCLVRVMLTDGSDADR